MIDDRARRVAVFIPGDFGAVADIDILQVGKMLLVKIADLLKNMLPVDRRTRAGGKRSGPPPHNGHISVPSRA